MGSSNEEIKWAIWTVLDAFTWPVQRPQEVADRHRQNHHHPPRPALPNQKVQRRSRAFPQILRRHQHSSVPSSNEK